MNLQAKIKSSQQLNELIVSTNGVSKSISIPAKANGNGSSVNGGELLLLALATCYCNDIYREAAKKNINVQEVEVEVTADFGKEGEPGTNFRYKPTIKADLSAEMLNELIMHTDKVAEIHNTLRTGVAVRLVK